MVTIDHIDELLSTKLAKLENNILKQLEFNVSVSKNPVIVQKPTEKTFETNDSVSKKFSEVKSTNLINDEKNPVMVHKPTEKTFDVECMELVKQVNKYLILKHNYYTVLLY